MLSIVICNILHCNVQPKYIVLPLVTAVNPIPSEQTFFLVFITKYPADIVQVFSQ